MEDKKKFKDLEFKKHSAGSGKISQLDFDNGYGVSVIFGSLFYSNGIDIYELAIFKDGNICYDSGITDDVLGHLSEEEVSEYMVKVQNLAK